jgi:hypothetical protein
MRHRGRDRPEADPLGHAEPSRELDEIGGERPPPIIRLVTGEQQQVAPLDRHGAEHELGPRELRQPAVHDVERRPAGSIVVELVVVPRGDDAGARRELGHGRRRRRARVDPSVERGDERRRDEVRGLDLVELVQGHGAV